MYVPKQGRLLNLAARIYHARNESAVKKYLRAIDAVSVLDTYNEAWCKDRGLHPTIVRLGVDAEKFHLPVKDFVEKAKRKSATLFGLGSLVEGRRYEDIIEAVRLLRERGYHVEGTIISNDMWQSPYRHKLEALVRDANLTEAIRFNFKGATHDELMKTYAATISLCIRCMSAHHASASVLVSAFSKPWLRACRSYCATRRPRWRFLEDGKTALSVDPMSPQQIADKVAWLIDHPEKYHEIATDGQRLVETVLTWENYAKGVLALAV